MVFEVLHLNGLRAIYKTDSNMLVNDHNSTFSKIVCGVPQFSIFEHILFLIYINDFQVQLIGVSGEPGHQQSESASRRDNPALYTV